MQFSNTVGKINNFRTDISDKGFEPDMSMTPLVYSKKGFGSIPSVGKIFFYVRKFANFSYCAAVVAVRAAKKPPT